MNEEETVEHLLRWCPKPREIWRRALGERKLMLTDNLGFREWIDINTKGGTGEHHDRDWAASFAIISWWIWWWRNEIAFDGEERDIAWKMEWIWNQIYEVKNAFAKG